MSLQNDASIAFDMSFPLCTIDLSKELVKPNLSGRTGHEENVTMLEKPTGASIPELATEYQVSESTLYSLANQGKLPGARRLGKRIVIHRSTFEDWLRSGTGEELGK